MAEYRWFRCEDCGDESYGPADQVNDEKPCSVCGGQVEEMD